MEKRDKADELIKSISSIEPLEDVPADVSVRFHETLSRLSSEAAKREERKSWLGRPNQFALAASFFLVFALGIVVNLNSDKNLPGQNNLIQAQPSTKASSFGVEDDRIQYSGGDKSTPKPTDLPIKISNSSHNYSEIPSDFSKKISVGITWNSTKGLSQANLACLEKLELSISTNLIDLGNLNGKPIRAIWVPLTQSSWNVYLIDIQCVAIEKKFVKQ